MIDAKEPLNSSNIGNNIAAVLFIALQRLHKAHERDLSCPQSSREERPGVVGYEISGFSCLPVTSGAGPQLHYVPHVLGHQVNVCRTN